MIFLVELLLRRVNKKVSIFWFVLLLLLDACAISAIIYSSETLGNILTPIYLFLLIADGGVAIGWRYTSIAMAAFVALLSMLGFAFFEMQNRLLLDVIALLLIIPSGFFFLYAKIIGMALVDPLTALPNRTLFQDRLEKVLKGCRKDGDKAALLFMDLDGFKQVNDTLGHNVGDQLLKEVSGRLGNVVRETDTIARLGGDEFAIILQGVGEPDIPVRVAKKVLEKFEEPFRVYDRLINVGISIGISLCPEHTDEIVDLIRFSDVAMYAAKKEKAGYVVYSHDYNKAEMESLKLASELRSAIKEGKLEIVYQPKIHLETNKIESVEALIRWEHEELGMIPPIKFIALAESSALINE
jgi:diguanylate cyclase (GGDEF)-like protein